MLEAGPSRDPDSIIMRRPGGSKQQAAPGTSTGSGRWCQVVRRTERVMRANVLKAETIPEHGHEGALVPVVVHGPIIREVTEKRAVLAFLVPLALAVLAVGVIPEAPH